MDKDKIISIDSDTPATAPVIHQQIIFHGPVHQMNSGSTVTNKYFYGADGELMGEIAAKNQDASTLDKAHIRGEIIEYVGRIYKFYTPDWQVHYIELWKDILDMPAVDFKIYKTGKQRDTHFNRNLVGKIIGYLDRYKIYNEDIVPAKFARELAKDGKGKSVRDALSGKLSPEICEAIKQLMNSKKYF